MIRNAQLNVGRYLLKLIKLRSQFSFSKKRFSVFINHLKNSSVKKSYYVYSLL